MFLVQMILYNKFKYWLARDRDGDYFWTGLLNFAYPFRDAESAENTGLAYSKVEFTIEKIIE